MKVDFRIDGLWAWDRLLNEWIRDGVVSNVTINAPVTNWGHGIDSVSDWYTPGAVFRNHWPDGTIGGWATLDGDACFFWNLGADSTVIDCYQR